METISIVIALDASVKIEVKGHQGAGCAALTEKIEEALGETIRDEKTHEYHQTAQVKASVAHRT